MVPSMNPNIPLPTDSLWKFSALFGLAVFFMSALWIGYIHYSTNELIYTSAIEQASLEKTAEQDSVSARKLEVLQKRREMAVADRPVLIYLASTLMAFGIFAAVFGFYRWGKMQPKQDRLLELEVISSEQKQLTQNDKSKRTLH